MATLSTHQKLQRLYYIGDPSTYRRIHLDRQSAYRLEDDFEAFYAMGVDERSRERTWRKIPIVIEAAPCELRAIGPADVPARMEDEVIEHEVQVTIECRRRDNGRVFYLDDPDNSPVWKLQGNPEA